METQTTSRAVGAVIKIPGSSLTGATTVTFNGTAATFAVASASEFKATAPTGATMGSVEVVTPGCTLKGKKQFTETP